MTSAQAVFEELYPNVVQTAPDTRPGAVAMFRLLGSNSYDGARLVECRTGSEKHPDACLLVMDVEVALGQRPVVNRVLQTERMAFAYMSDDALPWVCPLRPDFPTEVPHLNLAGRDVPRSLCLFEMPPEEALRLATPLVLIERVRLWLRETAYGRLHGDDQPLDPTFMMTGQAVVLPAALRNAGRTALYLGHRASRHNRAPIFLEPATKEPKVGSPMSTIVVVTAPLRHARLRVVPVDVAELLAEYEDLGVDLLEELRGALRGLLADPSLNDMKERSCLIVVVSPIERSPGEVGGYASKAFFTECTTKLLAQELGAFVVHEGFAGTLIGKNPVNVEALARLRLEPLDVYRSLDRAMALAASGAIGNPTAPQSVVLVGAGALGSQVALTAARMGLGTWTVVDDDHLLPHNLARHALSGVYVGMAKAEALVREINRLLHEEASKAIVSRVSDVGGTEWDQEASAIVLDASASVPVARWLALASTHRGVTASVFLNPPGKDLVLLVEGADRRPRLDHVEMSYYWLLANAPELEGHLDDGRVGLYPSGGCRHPSLAISQADVGVLAPFAVRCLLETPLPDTGAIEFRRMIGGGVVAQSEVPTPFAESRVGTWTVHVGETVAQGITSDRQKAGAVETGGILVGCWDRARRQIYVVGHYAPPPDSVASCTGFVRGADGVYETIETVQRRTAGNLTYIGEWHTHPAGMRSRPSSDDAVLLRWIEKALVFSDVPALMMIAGDDGVRSILGMVGERELMVEGDVCSTVEGPPPGSGETFGSRSD